MTGDRPIIHRRPGRGEYSTVVLPGGIVETMWFGDDGAAQCVGRSTVAAIAERHIAEHEATP